MGDLLITGGTGSFGHQLVRELMAGVETEQPRRIIIYSRDEYKQWKMEQDLPDPGHRLRFFLGDVRDGPRLRSALNGVETVIHAAALKQVPALEYNPEEAVKTNIVGAMNLVEAAIGAGVRQVMALSTDKACAPTNLYGATKLTAEKLFTSANALAGAGGTRFSCVRYGNVTGSRGSVVPLWRQAIKAGQPICITDPRMTRFYMTLAEAVAFVRSCMKVARGGEVFIPQLPAYRLETLARAMRPRSDYPIEETGIRPGEKMHESLISADEGHMAWQWAGGYVLVPWPTIRLAISPPKGAVVADWLNNGYSSASADILGLPTLIERLADVPEED